MRKRSYRIGVLMIAAVMLAASIGLRASALTGIDWTKKDCSITLTPTRTSDQSAVPGFQFTLYRVADAVNVGEQLDFRFTAEYEDSGYTYEDPAKDLAEYAMDQDLEPLAVENADAKGTVTFPDLPLGLYVLVQTGQPDGVSVMDPFYAMLPDRLNGTWIYDVNGTPKVTKAYPAPTGPSKPANSGSSSGSGSTGSSVQSTDGKLAQTGQLNWPIPVLASCGVVLFSLGWLMCFARRDAYV